MHYLIICFADAVLLVLFLPVPNRRKFDVPLKLRERGEVMQMEPKHM